MKVKWMTEALGLVVGAFLFFYPTTAAAGAAADQLRQTVDNLLAVLRNPDFKGEVKAKERREKLREIIYPRFDFTEMSKRALGSHWQRRSPEEQKEFVKLFADLLETAYVDKVESYNGEKVQYLNEKQEQNFAQADTRIVDKTGKDFSVNYRLHNVGGDWKVYDIVIENISLVNNYRSQFNRVLAKSSYEDLLQAMKEKRLGAPAPERKT